MKRTKRTLSLLLAALMLMSACLVGCSSVSEKPAVEFRDITVTRAVFEYLCCLKKTEYLYEAYGITTAQVSTSQLQDNAMIWETVDANGTTMADTLKMDVIEDLQNLMFLANYAQSRGYTLSQEQVDMIKKEFNSSIRQYGDKKVFNQQMKAYGVDYDQLIEYQKLRTLAYQGNELLFGEEGTDRVSDEAAKAHFNKSYYTMTVLFINTKNKTYPNGKTVVLPEAEKKEKEELCDKVEAALKNGEDFVSLAAKHSDLTATEEQAKEGVTLMKGSYSVAAVEEKVQTLAEGEWARVDVDTGSYFVKRLPLNGDYFTQQKEGIRDELEAIKKAALVGEIMEEFVMAEEFIAEISVKDIPFVV